MAETRDSSFPRDLLQRLMCTHFPVKPKEETLERPENVELSLGLSLNGRFGVEPQRMLANGNSNSNNKLFCASSVVDFVNFPADVELSLNSPLTRTCSLPPETATEWRTRKELQTFRRSEAKRKREEKMKNVRMAKGKTGEDGEGNRRNSTGEIELWGMGMKQSPASPPSPAPLGFSSHGSIVSQGSGGSSGVSDFESQAFPGINKDTEPIEISPKIISGFNRSRKIDAPNNSSQLVLPTDMPCVSTKGDGPDGKKIQGFLYRYGNGEEVRIVCVCHGSFLTPSEFVKHGGGGDVENPLRHIIVSSSICI